MARIHGDCGENMIFSYSSDTFTLTIRGNGEMYNYSAVNEIPWHSNRSRIEHIDIELGITSIGKMAFTHCEYLKTALIPSSVAAIGDNAFAYCSKLSAVTIPSSVGYIGTNAFRSCVKLTNVTIPSNARRIECKTVH